MMVWARSLPGCAPRARTNRTSCALRVLLEQAPDDLAADEPGGARDEDPLGPSAAHWNTRRKRTKISASSTTR